MSISVQAMQPVSSSSPEPFINNTIPGEVIDDVSVWRHLLCCGCLYACQDDEEMSPRITYRFFPETPQRDLEYDDTKNERKYAKT